MAEIESSDDELLGKWLTRLPMLSKSSLDLGGNLSGVKDNHCSCPIWPVVGDDGMEFDGCEKAVTAR